MPTRLTRILRTCRLLHVATKSKFGNRLKQLRVRAGFDSMRAFARASGVTPKLVELYESGQLSSPRYATAAKFAKALSVSVAELMDGTDAA